MNERSDIETVPGALRAGSAIVLTAGGGFLAGVLAVGFVHYQEVLGAGLFGVYSGEQAMLGQRWGFAEFMPALALAWLVHTRRRFPLVLCAVAYATYIVGAVTIEVSVGRTLGAATLLSALVVAAVLILAQVSSVLICDPRWLVIVTAGFGVVGELRGAPTVAVALWLLLACVGAGAPRESSRFADRISGLVTGCLAVALSALLPLSCVLGGESCQI